MRILIAEDETIIRLDLRELRGRLLACDKPLDERCAEPVDELGKVDDVLPVLGQLLVDRRDREDPVDRVAERLPRVDSRRARLEP